MNIDKLCFNSLSIKNFFFRVLLTTDFVTSNQKVYKVDMVLETVLRPLPEMTLLIAQN
jgi:hypothetical protein